MVELPGRLSQRQSVFFPGRVFFWGKVPSLYFLYFSYEPHGIAMMHCTIKAEILGGHCRFFANKNLKITSLWTVVRLATVTSTRVLTAFFFLASSSSLIYAEVRQQMHLLVKMSAKSAASLSQEQSWCSQSDTVMSNLGCVIPCFIFSLYHYHHQSYQCALLLIFLYIRLYCTKLLYLDTYMSIGQLFI